MLSVLVVFLAAMASIEALPEPGFGHEKRQASTGSCGTYEAAPMVKAPRTNPWMQISRADTAAVWDLVHDPKAGLNLTLPSAGPAQTDNYVAWIDTLRMI